MLRTVRKKGLHLLSYFLKVGGASMSFSFLYVNFVFIYWCIFFLIQKSMNVFVDYTNAALMRFATILKVHIIAHANMDSREMDENVEVDIGFNSDYVMKK